MKALAQRRFALVFFVLAAQVGSLLAANELESIFRQPPRSARPGVYWFWVNGNISRTGITADLEAMKRVGLGSALVMEVSRGEPAGGTDFMSESWQALCQHALAEARRLGLEVILNNSAGWEGSGGPWITPEQSMQELVWTETSVSGPLWFADKLPQAGDPSRYYRDVAVLAFPRVDEYRLPGFEAKAAYSKSLLNKLRATPSATPKSKLPFTAGLARDEIMNLSAHMDRAGRLEWNVPPGQWTIMRFGHASNGVGMKPVPKAGQGLNCDKLSPVGIEANFAGMLAKLTAGTGPKPDGPNNSGLVATHIDSWEHGAQNWTARMRDEFQRRRGYDLLPYLPVMTGRAVGSLEISERFLRDLRQTISELLTENYAGRMRELAHAQGLRFTCEAYNGPCDDIPYGGMADVPIGEFWFPDGKLIETCKGMASAAHLYGKPIVAAEAFTAGAKQKGNEHPGNMKALGDQAFCTGVNQFFFHRFTHQPWEGRRPGMGMGPFGIRYERTQTWWEWTPAWHEYLARCQTLLRQGMFVADICYLQPEEPPQRVGHHPREGYDWDECTADAVLTRMTVKDGRLVLPDGMSYRLLALSDSRKMTPQTLRKIKQLVEAGATVLGPRPLTSPSLSDFPNCDAEVNRLGGELWGDCDGERSKEHRVGQGGVIWGETPESCLQRAGVRADFTSNPQLHYIHRRANLSDIYFVANSRPSAVTATCSFRVDGKRPELWWPEDGRIDGAAQWTVQGGATHVVITLPPAGSVFVVFRDAITPQDPIVIVKRDGKEVLSAHPGAAAQFQPLVELRGDERDKVLLTTETPGAYELITSSGKSRPATVASLPPRLVVSGAWQVRFAPNWGGPAAMTFDRLLSWSEHRDPSVKYYSGEAVYTKTLTVSREMFGHSRRLYLDLGEVQVMAQVKCNGKELGQLWKAPFRVDLTDIARPGENQLEIKVVNLWANRQIGDEQMPDDSERLPSGASEHVPPGLIKAWPQWLLDGKPSPTERFTFASWRLWTKGDAPLASGLIGPVQLCSVAELRVK